jgi:SAM-dependent methyltransferase
MVGVNRIYMEINELQRNWDELGKRDPFYAILWCPGKEGRKWKREEFFETGRQEVEFTFDQAKALDITIPRGRGLDFGCGVGRLSQALVPYFEEVHGVDVAPSMIKLAETYNYSGNKCKYHLNEVDDLSLFPDCSFDFVFSMIVLQHIAPQYSRRYIKEFLRVLAPHGILVFQLPSERIVKPATTKPDSTVERQDLTQGVLAHTKQIVKRAIPNSILRWYRNIRYGGQETRPVVEMHGIPRAEVEQLVHDNGGKILHVDPHDGGLPNWTSFKYWVIRDARRQR